MIDLNTLKFDENGLIPAIVQDASTRQVLTLAYMNRESLRISMERGLTCFYSRSRQQLWLKGETSGNYQHIVSITADCDRDALVVLVDKDGPACHTGAESCFFEPVYEAPDRQAFSLKGLYALLEGNIDVLELTASFLATTLVGLAVTLLCRRSFIKHNPNYRKKPEKASGFKWWKFRK